MDDDRERTGSVGFKRVLNRCVDKVVQVVSK